MLNENAVMCAWFPSGIRVSGGGAEVVQPS